MNLEFEKILYNLLRIMPDKENLKIVFNNAIEQVGIAKMFNAVMPYQLTNPIEEYIDGLYIVF